MAVMTETIPILADGYTWTMVLEHLAQGEVNHSGELAFFLRWARLMQETAAQGDDINFDDEAISTLNQVLPGPVTDLRYCMWVAWLSRFWRHGEALRAWHNQRLDATVPSDIPRPPEDERYVFFVLDPGFRWTRCSES